MNWPTIGVIIPTFQRHDIVIRTVELLREYLRYSGRIKIRVSEDGSELPSIPLEDVVVVKGPSRGLGANLNSLLQAVDTLLVLQSDDDNWLTGPLDLDAHVIQLLNDPLSGWIRLQYIANHRLEARLEGWYWHVSWISPELYITSNKVHLKRRDFHDVFGLYPENLNLAETENGFCDQCKRIAENDGHCPEVLVPINLQTETLWRHDAESWQSKGY